MSKINHAIHEIYQMDTIASRNQWVNQLHPLFKLLVTVIYIFTVVSFSKYDVIGLLGMAVYLIVGFSVSDLSFKDGLYRLRVVLPLVCAVGIANPFFDQVPVMIGGITVRAGVISMITLMMKGVFAVLASYLLIATTTIESICYALRMIHIPSMIVTQILLTYRYITLLLQEVNRMSQAYALRAPGQKGVHYKVWGSLTGQLLLRSIDRANTVYESMVLRGYRGEFSYLSEQTKVRITDIIFLVVCISFILIARKYPILWIVSQFVGGLFV